MESEILPASIIMQAQDYWHLLQHKEGLLASTTTWGSATKATHKGTRVPGYCKYWCYIELQNHLIFPWCLFSLYVLAREGNTLFHIPSITVSNKASVPKGSSRHEAQKIRQALNTLHQCWVNRAFADPVGKEEKKPYTSLSWLGTTHLHFVPVWLRGPQIPLPLMDSTNRFK